MKFLAFFLVAVIACATVEQEPLESWLGNLWEKIKNAVKKAMQWIKDNGYWDLLVNTLKTAGKAAAKALCQKAFDADTCDGIIDKI